VKTTVEIADSLLDEAKACAKARRIPLRELIEEGLRTVVQRAPRKPFRLRDGSVEGQGPQPNLSWDDIMKLIYEGRAEGRRP
jgi:hypothetical protein